MSARFSLKDLLAVLGVIAGLFVVFVLISVPQVIAKQKRIGCVSRLKNLGLAYRIYSTDNSDLFPWERTNSIGVRIAPDTKDFMRYFTIISNEISTPKILVCPADKSRKPARNWNLTRTNVSYFLGLTALETYPQSIMSGDCNLVLNGAPIPSGVLSFGTNAPLSFDGTRHRFQGNFVMGDGSVQQLSTSRLNEALSNAGLGGEIVFAVP